MDLRLLAQRLLADVGSRLPRLGRRQRWALGLGLIWLASGQPSSPAHAEQSPTPPASSIIVASAGAVARPPLLAPPKPAPAVDRNADLKAPLGAAIAELESWVKASGGALGADVIDVKSGVEIAAASEDVAVNPASNQKLLVAAAALHHLGPNHHFKSGIYGRIQGGVAASLTIRSDGDPSFSLADLTAFAKALKALGLKRVSGDVFVDQSAFDANYVPPAFEQRPHEWAAFRAPVSAVALNRNSITLHVTPGEAGAAARVEFEPPGYMRWTGNVRTDKNLKTDSVKLTLRPRGARLGANISGAIGANAPAVHITRRIENPELYAGYVLRHLLISLGIKVQGEVKSGGSDEKNELVAHESKPLSVLLGELGKASDNFYAEMMLKAIGAHVRGKPGSSANGALVVGEWLRSIRAFEPGTVIGNGSGLYDANRTSPRTLVKVLGAAYRDPKISTPFLVQLAVGGVDGTLRARFGDLKPDRTIYAKTGTLNAVVALSGYVKGPDANSVAFSFIVTGITGRHTEVRKRIDAVVRRIHTALYASS